MERVNGSALVKRRRLWSRAGALLGITVLVLFSSCSPAYIVRAGWEEARILARRQDLTELIEDPKTDQDLKSKFQLVLDAREFAAARGLKPGGSYTQYSQIDRDVLVWVLTAAPPLSLKSYTWWFPIVGRLPYKGFFHKEDGEKAVSRLKEKGYDVFLRPSPAFSTLGWFDDPLLSTVIKNDDMSLVNTVIHEIVHNTIWFPNHAAFNETLANYLAGAATIDFVRARKGAGSSAAEAAQDLLDGEIVFAHFIHDTIEDMERFYQSCASHGTRDKPGRLPEELRTKRDERFNTHIARWDSLKKGLKSPQFQNKNVKLNNAVLIANRVYLDRMWLFAQLYKRCGNSLEKFMEQMVLIKREVDRGKPPFDALEQRLSLPGNFSS